MRSLVWGIVVGLSVAVAAGHAVALWNWEWPFYQNKVASHDAITFTRTFGVPAGAMIGGVAGILIHRSRRKHV